MKALRLPCSAEKRFLLTHLRGYILFLGYTAERGLSTLLEQSKQNVNSGVVERFGTHFGPSGKLIPLLVATATFQNDSKLCIN